MVRDFFIALDSYHFLSEAHIFGSRHLLGHSVAQFLQIGYVTPGSSRSNSSFTSYPQAGPVHGTPFPPSPLVPSPPRSKTSDDLPCKSPAAWQAGDSASASGSSTCVGSNSSATLYPQAGPVHGTPFVPSPLVPSPPRSKTFDDLPSKPPAAQTKAWKAGVSASAKGSSTRVDPELTFSPFPHDFTDGPEPTSLRSRARAPRFHMHPVLSYTRLHHAPISFDVAFTPSARTVVDRTVHSPFLAVTLAQPATEPPIPASSRLVLRSPILPWVVVVGPIGSPLSFVRGKDGEKRKAKSSAALTILDVLYAVHFTLMNPVTPEEWHSLGEGSRAQRRVAEAYKERCTRMGGGWEGGVRRVDWLGSKTHLVGVEIDRSNEGENVGKLVFGRPSSGRGLTAAVPARAASAAKP